MTMMMMMTMTMVFMMMQCGGALLFPTRNRRLLHTVRVPCHASSDGPSMPCMAGTVHTQHFIRAQSGQAALLQSQTCKKCVEVKIKKKRN